MRLNNFNLIVDTYTSIKSQVAKEFETTYHPSHIEFPVDIEVAGNETRVYFNLGIYQSKTDADLCDEISKHTSYCYDVNLKPTDRYGELVLTYSE